MAYSQTAVKAQFEPRCQGPWAKMALHGGAVVYVDPLITEAVLALNVIARHWDYRASGYDNAGQGCRQVAGTRRWSKHAYGIAIDREWSRNPHRRPLTTDRPAAMCRAINAVRTNNGAQVWYWGGYWSKPDAMHDEIVCFPSHLGSGIRWSSVAGYAAPAKKVSAADIRKLAAAEALPHVKAAPDMGPFTVSWDVGWIQKGLNAATGSGLKVDGRYDAWTTGMVTNFQNFVRNVLKAPMPDKAGFFGPYTRFYLAASLQNIVDGKA